MIDAVAMPSDTLRRVIDFNFFPSLEMDNSWWEADWLPTPLFDKIRSVKAAHRKLSDFILAHYQIKHENYFDFESYERQAALLCSADLKALLYKIGLIIESGTIASAIEKEAQQVVKKSLGEADYLYALKNNIAMSSRHTENNGSFSAQKVSDIKDFKSYVYQSGLRCLLGLLNDMPQGFIQRILFKLPKAWSATSFENKADYRIIKGYLPQLLN